MARRPVIGTNGPQTTRRLAAYIAGSDPARTPDAVQRQVVRAFVNIVGCMLGGCRDPASRAAKAALLPLGGVGQSRVVGNQTRTDVATAAFLNGLSSTIHTYDDTHLGTVVHPTGPAASVLLALADQDRVTGAEALHALMLGIEVTSRLACMLVSPPAHAKLGWFTTGIAGGIGAAATAARLLRLDEQQTVWALGLAAASAAGLRESHGTMAGGLIPAHAAKCGVTAALLAREGFGAAETMIEGPKGFASMFSDPPHLPAATEALGERFETLHLAYKPYPCGIVVHPAIDGCLDARNARGIRAEMVERVDLVVHPLTLQLCGLREPRDGMDAKASLYHWAAAALVRGQAGLSEGTDSCVADPAVMGMRARIAATPDATLGADAARVTVCLRDRTTVEIDVRNARGSADRPMADAEIDDKFVAQSDGVLAPGDARSLLAVCRGLGRVHDLGAELSRAFDLTERSECGGTA